MSKSSRPPFREAQNKTSPEFPLDTRKWRTQMFLPVMDMDPGNIPVVDKGPKTFEGLIVRRKNLKSLSNGTSYATFLLAIQVVEGEGIEKGMVLVRRFYGGSMIQNVFDELFLAREGHKLTVPYTTKDGNIEIDPNQVNFNTQQLARDHHEKQERKDRKQAAE